MRFSASAMKMPMSRSVIKPERHLRLVCSNGKKVDSSKAPTNSSGRYSISRTGRISDSSGSLLGKRRRVLVVEDNKDARQMVTKMLRKKGFEVETAIDGIAAEKLLCEAEPPFNLIIADIELPKLGGEELIKGKHERDPVTPVICMTGYDIKGDFRIKELMEKGMIAAALQKPFTMKDFFSLIEEIFLADKKND